MLKKNNNSIHFGQNSSKVAAFTRSSFSCKDGIKGNIREMGVKVWTRLCSCSIEFGAGFYEYCDKTPNSLYSLHNCSNNSANGNAVWLLL
jgi:CRISPR/Cas system endoribonuclease Cas6 (RAMP superfamily)